MTEILALHAVPDLRQSAGGIAAILPPLCDALRAEGVESRIIALAQDDGGALAGRTQLLAERSPLRLRTRLRQETAHWRAEARRSGRNFLCHSHGLWSFLNHAHVAAAHAEGVPAAISLHGMLLPWALGHKALRKSIAWWLYQGRDFTRANGIHVTSEVERTAAEQVGVRGDVAVIPFGVELARAFASPAQAPAAAGRTLLFLGRVHPIKNLVSLIDAFRDVRPEGWRLLIVGPNEEGHRELLRQRAQDCGIADRVLFNDPVFGEVKSRLFAESELLILPSHAENFGVVVAEALAHGVPAIASTGTPWPVLETERCGWWVAPDRDNLAAALRVALKRPAEDLRAMGRRGQAYIEANLTWPLCACSMAAFYRHLVEISRGGHFPTAPSDEAPSSMQPSR
jgi:glycosyltransferase involved in cell wall biosynthesis